MESRSNDTLVESTGTSLKNRDGNCLQPLERGVVPAYSIQTEQESSLKSDEMVVLLSLLEGLTANTLSRDVVELAVYRAKDTCDLLGVDANLAEKLMKSYLRIAKQIRSKNQMAWD